MADAKRHSMWFKCIGCKREFDDTIRKNAELKRQGKKPKPLYSYLYQSKVNWNWCYMHWIRNGEAVRAGPSID